MQARAVDPRVSPNLVDVCSTLTTPPTRHASQRTHERARPAHYFAWKRTSLGSIVIRCRIPAHQRRKQATVDPTNRSVSYLYLVRICWSEAPGSD
eukprot:12213-Prymnesium_polylepis.2